MGNERLGMLAFPLPQLSLFLLVLSLSKGLFGPGGENAKEKELCELLNGHRAMNCIVTRDC
jgi:hypothetical protein